MRYNEWVSNELLLKVSTKSIKLQKIDLNIQKLQKICLPVTQLGHGSLVETSAGSHR